MHISILFVGQTPPPMQEEFGRYSPQFQNLLAPVVEDARFDIVRVLDGEPIPEPDDMEAVVVSGSAFGVYDQPDWMEPMRAFVRKAYDVRLPMFGVCFGHQLIADALGGDVRRSEKGWGIGRHTYDVDIEALGGIDAPQDLALAASHKDQVISPPDSARTFLCSEFTPHAGLVYDNDAIITVQPHPEFDVTYAKGLCRLRLNDPHTEDEVRTHEKTFDDPLHRSETASLVGQFLKRAKKPR